MDGKKAVKHLKAPKARPNSRLCIKGGQQSKEIHQEIISEPVVSGGAKEILSQVGFSEFGRFSLCHISVLDIGPNCSKLLSVPHLRPNTFKTDLLTSPKNQIR